MPVSTISADKIVFVNGKPTIAPSNGAANTRASKSIYSDKSYKPRKPRYQCRAVQLTPRFDLVTPGSPVAVDCEGVQLVQEIGWERRGVGRISIVNVQGDVVYDTFVYNPKDVEHRPSPQRLNLGVKYNDIKPENGAQARDEVLRVAEAIFDKSGIVFGHAIENDKVMLRPLDFSKYAVYDTQASYAEGSRGQYKPGLRNLAERLLGRNMQKDEHSSVEDARATMEIYLLTPNPASRHYASVSNSIAHDAMTNGDHVDSIPNTTNDYTSSSSDTERIAPENAYSEW